ncbi:MAG: alternative ribosome rescue aminoacyl-tRNA hydrolase ArfB [candidate division NC10 bacterium]|nr:alternative ribosome rescue aminoacyl-tRNA hydrolase ArfB [candidate division NC10 bacterium]
MIQINDSIAIDEGALRFEFLRASGPGGQNVNKVSTAVRLRFDVLACPSLPEEVRARLLGLAGRRIGQDGVLCIEARRFRTQESNRRDAVERLVLLVRKAVEKPKPRRETKPSRASKVRRLEAVEKPKPRRETKPSRASKVRRLETKRRRGQAKQTRKPLGGIDD